MSVVFRLVAFAATIFFLAHMFTHHFTPFTRIVKRDSVSEDKTASCEYKGQGKVFPYDTFHVFNNRYANVGTQKYFNAVLDSSTDRNVKINSQYYNESFLNQFKSGTWYTTHSSAGQKGKHTSSTHVSQKSGVPPNDTSVEFLTGGKKLLKIHSHNDYTRSTPLFDALQRGYQSVEADLYVFTKGDCDYNNKSLESLALASDLSTDGSTADDVELFVGHKYNNLSKYRTLKTVYLNYLKQMLDEINDFYGIASSAASDEKAGVFFNYPHQTLNVIIDFKNSDYTLFRVLMRNIKFLIDANYVSHYDFATDSYVNGPITFILSGKAPFDLLNIEDMYRAEKKSGKRYVFIDAPLMEFTASSPKYDYARLAKLASAKFEEGIKSNETKGDYFKNKNFLNSDKTFNTATVNATVTMTSLAHKYGVPARLWGMPDYDDTTEYMVNKDLLLQCKMDYLNTDDLDKAAGWYLNITKV